MLRQTFFRFVSIIVFFGAAGLHGNPAAAVDVQTQQSAEDLPLPSDPANLCGQFDNGLHYVIRKNANPPGKVYLNLAVRTGALNETAEQNGLAHFLEHMAFKGSAHFAPTKLIPLLTHLGMQFGADTNAHTNQYETVFKLSMPDNKPATLELALNIFSDYASALDLAPVQIDSERRVILEEMRVRRNVGLRFEKAMDAALFPGTQMAAHDVLGDPQIIKTAPPALFQDYWNKWYRPEKMTLIVVGDVDPEALIAQAKPLLGTFTARAPAQLAISAGLKPTEHPRAVVLSDPEQIAGEAGLISLKPARPFVTTTALFRRKLVEQLAQAIVNRRLSDLVVSGKAPFRSADVNTGDVLHDAFSVSASATGESADWATMLDGLIQQINVAVQHGFNDEELNLVRTAALVDAEHAVRTESSFDSSDRVTSITASVDTDAPMISSSQRLELLEQLLPAITVKDLQAAFTDDFATANYAYFLKLPAVKDNERLPTEQEILAAASAAWGLPTVAAAAPQPLVTLLAAAPAPGHVVSTQSDADLGLTTAVFENGAVMHHRFSDYRKDQVLVRITLPGGAIEETAANHGISAVASLMLARLSTERATSLQIRDWLIGKNVSVGGRIDLDTLNINISGSPGDLASGLELANAILVSGRLEQPALEEWKKNALLALRGRPSDSGAQLAEAINATVMGGDVRFAALTRESIAQQDRSAAEAWFHHIADRAAIEVSVVGDISKDDALAVIGKYIGSLPKRSGTFGDLDALRHLDRQPGPYERDVQYQNIEPKAVVFGGFLSCDESSPDRRPLSLASLILSDRMVRLLRFEKQLIYSIGCKNVPSHGMPGTGIISASAPTDPKNAQELGELITSMIKDFAASGPTEDELATAKKQIANQLSSQMKEPEFWLMQTAELQYRGRPLEDLKQLPGIFQSFSVEQVRAAVRKYATDDRMIRMKISPIEHAQKVVGQPATEPVGSANPLPATKSGAAAAAGALQ